MVMTEEKAMSLMAEAEKNISSSKGFFGSLFGRSAKIENAIECYQRAANIFKMTRNWERAGSAFRKAAGLLNKAASRHEAASSFVDAATCYKKSSADEAENCLLQAIEIYTDLGRFSMAAKHHQSIAEIYESGRVNHEKVVQHYEQAADYYRGEEVNSSANKCLMKVAQYSSELEDYEKAITIYQENAQSSLESPLLKYSAKEYMFKAALCHLCVDFLNAQHAIQQFMQMFPAFRDSRECKLLFAIIEHIEEQNVDGFTDAVKEYDSISRLDPWHTMILLRIKRQLNDDQDLR